MKETYLHTHRVTPAEEPMHWSHMKFEAWEVVVFLIGFFGSILATHVIVRWS